MQINKKCSYCKIEKQLEDFHKNKSAKFGHSNYCIECKKLTRKNKVEAKEKPRNRKFEETYNHWIVYEFYDHEDVCLYVGQSKSFAKRFIQHKYIEKITDRIKRITCYVMASFPDMAFLEAQKIIEKQPKYNTRISESCLSKFSITYITKLEYDINGEIK